MEERNKKISKKMVKSDFAKLYSTTYGIEEKEAVKDVEIFLETMADAFKKYSKITIRNIGVFEVRETKERVICDPRGTGEKIKSKPRKYIKFKASKNLENILYDKDAL